MYINDSNFCDMGNNREDEKGEIEGKHAAPIDRYLLMKSLIKQEIGFPEHGEEKYTNYFSEQNADDSVERC